MPSPVLLPLAMLLLLAGCGSTQIAHTPGEIPRDTNGKPIWSLIEPRVAVAATP